MLLHDAIARIGASPVGAHAIFADAIDEAAVDFYREHLFTPFATKPIEPVSTARDGAPVDRRGDVTRLLRA